MNENTPLPMHQDSEMTIRDGAELKRVLRVAGYSQREIAEYIGYSRSYVNSICNGLTDLTLRVVEGVKDHLGDRLFILALKRARQLEVEETARYEDMRRRQAIEAEMEREQAREREERRRSEAAERLLSQLQSDESHDHDDHTENNARPASTTPD